MREKLLEIRDLKVIYKTDEETVEAVNNIDLDLYKGESLGIVGETGAGKTTTALSIIRLLPYRVAKILSGEIIFNEQNLLELSEKDMRKIRGNNISMIFQDPMSSLNPVLTVEDQIAEVLRLHMDYGKEMIKKRVKEVLQLVGIPHDRMFEYPHQFSGGMKQRVGIAIALACDPDLLIADEPTTALDVTIQAQVLNMIDELQSRLKTSMILITHDLGVVAQTCDNVAIMYAGEIVESGTAKDIFEGERHHPYTEGLFGSIPNLDIDEKRLNPIQGVMPEPSMLPSGCRFHPRCPHCMDICIAESPQSKSFDGHHIKCHLFL